VKADLIGCATIAACVALLAWLVPETDVPRKTWLLAVLALAACAWFWSRHPNAPNSPKGWLKYLGYVVVIAFILIPVHAAIYGTQRRHLVFDFSLLAFGLIVVVACLARSFAKGEHNEG
jgi:FtsH-binding integral membrane protein